MDAARDTRPRTLARSRAAPARRLHAVVRDCCGTGSIRLEREDGLPRIVVRRLDSGEEHVIAFAEEAYSLGIEAGYEFATNLLRFSYSSMTTPAEVWDYDLATRERTLRKRQEVPSGHDPADYVTRRCSRRPRTARRVPISLLHRKDVILGRDDALPALRLRRLRHLDSCGVQHQPAVAGRSRLRLCHRPCARRQREGLALVPRRQAREEAEHASAISSPRPNT